MFSNIYRHTLSCLGKKIAFAHVRNTSQICAQTLQYTKFGEPADVLELVQQEIPEPTDCEVLVKILAAPINPSDINTIQGKYPVKPPFPAIAGNEGVAEVLCVGEKVKKLKPGQRVVVAVNALGTWRTHAIFDEHQLMGVPAKLDLAAAATLIVNPPTAYRMLKDFVPLARGDCVIQNGANSAVGQIVHQLCKAWGINSVGVVRHRPNVDELKEYLKTLGATEILTEEELSTTEIFKKGGKLRPPRLALNCVGGKNASNVARLLAPKGVMVTYGGMSRNPLLVSTPALIFKNISYCGFWITRWSKEQAKSTEREKMFQELVQMLATGVLKGAKCEMVPLKDYKRAVAAALDVKGLVGKKLILDMSC
ncbi:enoyl-[acyl-carrier-protein] reductase, mitochondrial-like [Eurosta solidaginis]|uniref:enoyl-[acyl-carrier-protein] reductase, mitochondrial-like n=1 Tax=Eurosta solidaginis TaxID=178769 RepID=UPI0035314A1A